MNEIVPQGPRGISYDKATLIPASAAPRFLWGDREAGYVSDWIYGSSPNIHMMSFEMNVGSRFGNSPNFKTYYNAAETYHCLKGEFTFHCPETGEVHVLKKGDTLYFPPNTWHWGYNFGSETCWILESLTPRNEEAIEAYAVKQPWLSDIRYGPREAIGRYASGDPGVAARARLVKSGDYLFEIVGETRPLRVGIVCSTDMLTTAIVDLYPGQESELITHPSDQVMYCLAGRMNVHLPDEQPNWWELKEGDAAFIPAGCAHAFANTSDAMAKFLFSVAPVYR
ncbi:MAG: cupin domain-containing protein [Hyphomicrobiales bacterium]|nr:cupin domain-containing protein [Hyphomicrobiales bacterium]